MEKEKVKVIKIKQLKWIYIDDFIEHQKSKITQTTYRTAVNSFWRYLEMIDNYFPSRKTLEDYKAYLQQQNYSIETIRTYLFVLKIFFSWLQQNNLYINYSDTLFVPEKTISFKKNANLEPLTKEDVVRLIKKTCSNTKNGLRDAGFILILAQLHIPITWIINLNIGDYCFNDKYKKAKLKMPIGNKYYTLDVTTTNIINQYLCSRKPYSIKSPLFVSSVLNVDSAGRLYLSSVSRLIKQKLKECGKSEYSASNLKDVEW